MQKFDIYGPMFAVLCQKSSLKNSIIYTEWVRAVGADSHGFKWLGSRRTGAGFNVGCCCCCSGFVNRGVVLAGFVGGCCYGDFARLLGSRIATSLLLVLFVAAGSGDDWSCGCCCRASFDRLGDGCLRDV